MPGWLMRRPLPGISACPASAGQHVLLGLRFQELSWDHTSPEEEEPVLWLEFDGDSEGTPVNKLLRIYSKQVGRHYPPPVPRHLAAGSVLGSGGCTEGAGGLRSPGPCAQCPPVLLSLLLPHCSLVPGPCQGWLLLLSPPLVLRDIAPPASIPGP